MYKILFVCSGNTCRSPMAEYIFNNKAAEQNLDMLAKSAGLHAFEKLAASPNTLAVLQNNGIEAGDFLSRNIQNVDLGEFDKIICMTKQQASVLDGAMSVSDYIGFDISDPYGMDYKSYEKVFKQLGRAIEKIIKAQIPPKDL